MNNSCNNFFDEIAEDFFAECDELMTVIKRNLLKIDGLSIDDVPSELIDELLRSCHTLKGLTGMAGADETMKLTHSIETYLKSISKGEAAFTDKSIDILFRSIAVVENHLDCLRNKKALPDSLPVMNEIDALNSENNSNNFLKAKSGQQNIEKALQSGETLWRFFFKPSKELFKRGININEVRNRIGSLGKIISSSPKTDEDNNISFEFLVTTDKPESSFASWIDDGINFVREEVRSAVPENEYLSEKDIKAKAFNIKNIVRVDLTRLDDIMRSVGELVISRSRLNDFLQNYGTHNKEFENLIDINGNLEKQIREVRESIMKLRLVSANEAFDRMKFVIRDLLKENEKIVDLRIEGHDVFVDKFIIDRIFDPLLHIVRNAVSHGIETPEERRMAGKPEEAVLKLKASTSGNTVLFEVSDDGRGINREQVQARAKQSGMISQNKELSDKELLDVLCTHGFTTREKSDMVSGRGVGMDIVKKTVNELGGQITMQTETGKGTRFNIILPLTLSIVEALIVKAGGNVYAVPMPSVEEVMKIETKNITTFEQNEILNYRGFILPLLRLNKLFGLKDETPSEYVIVIEHRSEKTGIVINKILGHREIVVKSLTDPLVKVNGIYGVTDLGDGNAILILDAHALIESVTSNHGETIM